MPPLSKNRFVQLLLSITVGTVVAVLALEGLVRILDWYKVGRSITANPKDTWDDTLGWLGKEHVIGPPGATPLLVLGDSFTEGLGLPPNKLWFSYLSELFPSNRIIAYGGLGYNTLQELLVLKQYLARGPRPGAIILQACTNDILNNYYQLEVASYLQRPPAPRPYWEGGAIRTRFPRSYGRLALPFLSYSRFAYKLSVAWDARMANKALAHQVDSVEYQVQRIGYNLPAFRSAIQVTDYLLGEMKRVAAEIPLIMVLIDDGAPFSSAIRDSAKRHEIPFIAPVLRNPLPPDHKLPDGAHLNERGNQAIGEAVNRLIKERNLLTNLRD